MYQNTRILLPLATFMIEELTPCSKVIITASTTCTTPYEGTVGLVTEPAQSEIMASILSN